MSYQEKGIIGVARGIALVEKKDMKLFLSYRAKDKNGNDAYGNVELIINNRCAVTIEDLRECERFISQNYGNSQVVILYYQKLEG